MIDDCGNIKHLSSTLLLQWAMVKHPTFLYSYSHSYLYSYSYSCYLQIMQLRVATVSICKSSSFSQLHDWCLVRQWVAVPWLMFVATASTCKSSCFFAAPWLMLVTTVSTSKASNVAQLLDLCLWRQQAIAKPPVFHRSGISQLLLMLLLQIQDWCLLRQSALVKHSVFRSSMIDACGDIEHLSSILLLQWAMIKHPVCPTPTRTLTPTPATCKSSSCLLRQSAFANHPMFRSSLMDAWCDSQHL